jgi:serine protease Do
MAQYQVETPGVYIMSDENPAGLLPGDRIVSVDGEAIAASADLSAVLEQHKVGDILSVTVEHYGEDGEETVEVTLKENVPETQQFSFPA